ncbi:Serine/threonine protein kinase [Nannocystis exedens]|uniref:Serine/threonine protein kinase n=1 Tax=Nannocystis exedens TaxID=54 RepID=A0A1I1ZB39_9BACT|nr:serine/threonine-protein kinase [Nannocystis exedens]PCC75123.1 Serine/threonine-protein kinase PrkC [Nannocystis exedens]SFE27550.1 Serine/threonine protein kinase [Nannocystis exedens]
MIPESVDPRNRDGHASSEATLPGSPSPAGDEDTPAPTGDEATLAGSDAPSGVADTLAARGDEATLAAGGPPGGRTGSALRRGDLVGRYVVLDRLGAGGMGVVFAAYDPELDRKVALKLLRTAGERGSATARARLVREAQAMARLTHPNVVTVHDVGTLGDDVWVAMEFVRGVTLRRWLTAAPRPWRAVVAVAMEVGRGVAAAHAAGLVHRDLKPDNVMVADDGRVLVMDFGLARSIAEAQPEAETEPAPAPRQATSLERTRAGDLLGTPAPRQAPSLELTRAGDLLGTPAYMAPEQLLGLPTDARTDQFSFCVMLWEALYGVRPFAGDTLVTLTYALTQGPPPTAPRNSAVPRWVRRVVERGVAREPDQRWPSMAALLTALGRDPSRSRWGLAAVATVAIAGMTGFGFTALTEQRARSGCAAAAGSIDAMWSQRAEAAAAGLAAAAPYGADTWARVEPRLARWRDAWHETREQLCVAAEVEETLTPANHAAAIECLAERRAGLELALELFAAADAEVVQRAVSLATSLAAPAACAEARASGPVNERGDPAARQAARSKLARAQGLQAAGRYAEGLALARAVAEAARTAAWPAIEAGARIEAGVLAGRVTQLEPARRELERAFRIAGAAGLDAITADAALELTSLAHLLARPAEAYAWERTAEMLLVRLGEAEGPRAARLAGIRGAALHDAGMFEAAQAEYERMLALQQATLGLDHPELAVPLSSLAMIRSLRGDLDGAEALHRQALALSEAALGPSHPYVGASLLNLGTLAVRRGEVAEAERLARRALELLTAAHGDESLALTAAINNLADLAQRDGRSAEALVLHRRNLELYERVLGPEHPDLAATLGNLGATHHLLGEHAEARRFYTRAIAVLEAAYGPEHADLAQPLSNLALLEEDTGRPEAARPLYLRALAIEERARGPGHAAVAEVLLSLADIELTAGRPAAALPNLERALAIGERLAQSDEELAPTRLALAQVLGETGGDRARAQQLARLARGGFAAAGDAEALAEADAWLQRHAKR